MYLLGFPHPNAFLDILIWIFLPILSWYTLCEPMRFWFTYSDLPPPPSLCFTRSPTPCPLYVLNMNPPSNVLLMCLLGSYVQLPAWCTRLNSLPLYYWCIYFPFLNVLLQLPLCNDLGKIECEIIVSFPVCLTSKNLFNSASVTAKIWLQCGRLWAWSLVLSYQWFFKNTLV